MSPGAPPVVTFVTGASSGIGRSLARRLAAAGSPVALAARREALLTSLAEEILSAGGRALVVPCDVTDADAVREAVARAVSALGPIERLVANAGGGDPTDVAHFEAAQIERVFALNVLGAAHCIEAVLPGMLERRRGHLVAMSSLAARGGLPTGAAYTSAKGALSNLMESLRIDLRPRGVDVTVLEPGFVRTKTRDGTKRGRPLGLELEDATTRMQRAIEARRPRAAFPMSLVAVVGMLRLLPPALADRLLGARGR